MLIRLAFVVWVMTITVLAVIPHADDGLMVASNVTSSGMEKHVVGYFVGAFLLYYGYVRKGGRLRTEDGGQRTEDRGRKTEDRGQRTEDRGRKTEDRGQRTEGFYIWLCGLVIFGYSVVLEFVQFFLPYRTFNLYDIFGNGIGVGAFCLIFLALRRKGAKGRRTEDRRQRTEGGGRKAEDG